MLRIRTTLVLSGFIVAVLAMLAYALPAAASLPDEGPYEMAP